MDEQISEQAKLARSQREVEVATSRRRIGRSAGLGGAMLVVSTLLAWMNHPRIVRSSVRPHPYIVVEVSHSIGLATWSAGPIVLILGTGIGLVARWLVRGDVRAGWVALLMGFGSLGVSVAEFTQLLLGRQDYLDHASLLTPPLPPSADAVGIGVWLAVAASIVVVVAAWGYIWRARRYWKVSPTT